MSGLTKIHNKLWFHVFNKHFLLKHFSSFIPVLLVLYVLSLFSLIFLTTPQRYASAGPTPPPTPTLSTSVSSPNVNFQFSQSELVSSTFKDSSVYVSVDTNNKTGATSYISSIDEDTNLNHTDPAVTEKISSITSPMLSSAFAQKSWGYHVIDGLNNTFKPVPKASTPDTISVTNSPSGSPYSIGIDFGVKSSPDLPSGNYSKQILFTTITNRVPNKATFKTGMNFNSTFNSVVNTSVTPIDYFKHSTTPPANFATVTIVSADDSERPIYLWYNSADKTVYWWSDADNVYANEDASSMFNSLYINQLADLRGINFSKTKNMNSMFAVAKTGGFIKKVNFDGFDTSNVEDMSYMFRSFGIYGPISSDAVAGISNFNTSKVKNMSGMFNDANIKKLDLSSWDTKNVTDMSKMFDHAYNLAELNLNNFNTSKVTNMRQMFAYASDLTNLDVTSFDTSHVTDMFAMFSGTEKLSSLNLSHFNTSNVTNMSVMFYGDKSIVNLDLSSFNTSNVTDMSRMFTMMEGLKSLNLSSFDTSHVTDMSAMFAGDKSLPNLDVTSFDTSNVTDMTNMFASMGKLSSLDLSHFNTSKVTKMESMFGAYTTLYMLCKDTYSPERSLTSLDLSSFDTSHVTNMAGMFSAQINITNLNLSNFNTSQTENMDYMFCGMTKLQNLNLSSFDTSHVTNMESMFESSMMDPIKGVLDISSFSSNNLHIVSRMFYDTKIKTIYTQAGFNTYSGIDIYSVNVFHDNIYLVGGNGTAFISASSPTDRTYGRVDAPGTPGYFTKKP